MSKSFDRLQTGCLFDLMLAEKHQNLTTGLRRIPPDVRGGDSSALSHPEPLDWLARGYPEGDRGPESWAKNFLNMCCEPLIITILFLGTFPFGKRRCQLTTD